MRRPPGTGPQPGIPTIRQPTRVRINSTYRLQLRPDVLTFADAVRLVDYIEKLGISHLYLSPVLTPMRGSTHGYDVADPTTVNPGLGGPAGLRGLSDELRRRGMGLIVDIVPSHVGVADPRQNRWWYDVLEHGAGSEFARFFDLDLDPDNGADGRLALPVLNGEPDPVALGVDRSGPRPMLALGQLRFPIAAGTVGGTPEQIHSRQHYRLVDWRSGIRTYRRFLAVDSLAGLRQEDPAVFDATHRELAAWCRHDLIDGVRVDDVDGLAYPTEYLARLRELIGPRRLLLVEKILGADEPLDPTLPVDGTTGYESLNLLGGLFVDPDGEQALTRVSERYAGNNGDRHRPDDAASAAKRTVARTLLAPDVRRLVAAVHHDAQPTMLPDVTTADLTAAVIELIAAMPVHRTDYPALIGTIGAVTAAVQQRQPRLARPLAVVVAALSTRRTAAVRFHQTCSAVMAKAVEDRVSYRDTRLVSLQEVGGSPARFSRSVHEFHLANSERARFRPVSLTTLSTHDTKRGEDVRARISVLSQIGERWADHVETWQSMTPFPDGQTALFLLQNLVGIWPVDGRMPAGVPGWSDRVHAYAEKTMREAATKTTWENPDIDFEKSVHAWLDTVIDGPVGESLGALATDVAPHGWSDSLGQKLLQLCGPGVPDIYQGTEIWEDSLTDPDNRRPVEFDMRSATLDSLVTTPRMDASGAAKIWITAHALWLRRERPHCFVGGTYLPLYAVGAHADHLVAFARGAVIDRPEIIAAVTRWSMKQSTTGWADTALQLPDGMWQDRLTGAGHSGQLSLTELFTDLPVALLVKEHRR